MEKDYFKLLSRKVQWILSEYPETMNSDIKLFTKIIEIFYNGYIKKYLEESHIKLADMNRLPNQCDVSRQRRRIQNTYGMYLSSEKIYNFRNYKKEELLKALGYR